MECSYFEQKYPPIIRHDSSTGIIVLDKTEKGSIALALGGGAARGWAHIGVLRALDEAQARQRGGGVPADAPVRPLGD